MSLADNALRICTVYALRGKTFAGQRVHDSPGNPLPEKLPGVVITVFSGASSVAPDGRDLIGGDAESELSIHIHLPDHVELFTGADPIRLDMRQGGTGPVFDFIWRQMVRALLGTDPWAELWRVFAAKLGKVTSSPYILEADKGGRFESREIRIPVEPIFDPPFGELEPASPWARLLELMEANPETARLAPAFRFEIESPTGLSDWNVAAAALGLAPDEVTAIGIAPVQPQPADGEPANEPVTLWTVESTDTEEAFTVDATTPDPGALP